MSINNPTDAGIAVDWLAMIYRQNAYIREGMSFDDLEVVARHTRGTQSEALDQLHAWLSPIGQRPLRESAIEAALRSSHGPANYEPGGRVLSGDALPALATVPQPDGRLQLHRGDVAIPLDVPALWNHQPDQVLGRLVGYRRNLLGPGSLRVWVELAGGKDADDVLLAADYGRIGLSVGLYHAPKQDDGGTVVAINGRRLFEISLTPLANAVMGDATVVRRMAAPSPTPAISSERAAVSRGLQYR